ncbi:MAG: 3-oxoacyl-[acyl-carrier-protein] reductase [Bacillota bacterium]
MNNQKVAIVTGATGGIGKAIVKTLAASGYALAINYRSDETTANDLVKTIEENGGTAVAYQADVSDFEASKAFVASVLEDLGSIGLLVNNAGITKDQLMLRMKENDFDTVMNVNLKGAWNMCKHVTRPMFKQKSGRIVNITSVIGEMGNAGQANYAASKAGMIGLTKSLAKEYGKKNITVNAVSPGFIETKMTESLDEAFKETYLKTIPLGRGGTPGEVAELVEFLASGKAAYITGQVIGINGGMYS